MCCVVDFCQFYLESHSALATFANLSFLSYILIMVSVVNSNIFLGKSSALIGSKPENNCFYFSQERYSKILSEVRSAKTKFSTSLDL